MSYVGFVIFRHSARTPLSFDNDDGRVKSVKADRVRRPPAAAPSGYHRSGRAADSLRSNCCSMNAKLGSEIVFLYPYERFCAKVAHF